MARDIRLEYRRRPSALAFMLRAVGPSPGLGRHGVPAIAARWRHRVEPRELAGFLALSDLPAGEALPFLYPHTFSFPLDMTILTQPAFPLPIWKMLQIRNRIVQRAPIAPDATLEFSVRVAGHRILAKGAEFDLHTTVHADGEMPWESVNTFYVRGRFGTPTPGAAVPAAPQVGAGETARWRMPAGGGLRYGRLSGDYNPLHLWNGYARRHGFGRAFFHPQRVLGHCLARLPQAMGLPLRLDTWLKGPVFYGAEVALHCDEKTEGTDFALHVAHDRRPAIVGRLRRAAPDEGVNEECGWKH